jgi:hypothetical protein
VAKEKKKKPCWYKLEAYVQGDVLAEVEGQEAILQARYYNERGEPILMVVQIDSMEAIPLPMLHKIRQLVTMQHGTPTLVVPKQVNCVQLREMEPHEVRRTMDSVKRADPMPPPNERRIIMP